MRQVHFSIGVLVMGASMLGWPWADAAAWNASDAQPVCGVAEISADADDARARSSETWSNGDIYAGRDGNVYRYIDGGWQKREAEGWRSVQGDGNANVLGDLDAQRQARALGQQRVDGLETSGRVGGTGFRRH